MSGLKLFAGISKLDEAQADVADAKARLANTVGDIQSRLAPSRIFDDAMAGVKSGSADFIDNAGGFARKRPAAVSALVTAMVLLAAHRPILRLLRHLLRKPPRNRGARSPVAPKQAPRSRRARPKG